LLVDLLVGGHVIVSIVEVKAGLFKIFGKVDFLPASNEKVLVFADDDPILVFNPHNVCLVFLELFSVEGSFSDCDGDFRSLS